MCRFTIRVYGILITPNQQLLVSDELIRGQYYTKFPGGGLEFGEGTRDCLKREFLEEMNLNISVEDHLYTTDYFQLSAFNSEQQVISIYYYVRPLEEIMIKMSTKPFDFTSEHMKIYKDKNEIETFRFLDMATVTEESVSLPIDKIVIRLLK